MLKKASILLFSILLCLLAACEKEEAPAVPGALAMGFHGEGYVATGGAAEEVSDLNLKALEISAARSGDAEETVLTFSFVTGSRMSGSEKETPGVVPAYTVSVMDYPARLVVQFENLAHWDYRRGLTLPDTFLGTFQQSIVNTPRISICFQLSEPMYYIDAAGEDTLTIRLRRHDAPQDNGDPQTPKELYYVTVNAYDAYRAGQISPELDASPTLSTNLGDILLISPPFETMEQAEGYLVAARRQYPNIIEEKWVIQALRGQQLPHYDSALDHLAAIQTPSIRLPDQSLKTLPVLVPDGLFLCELPTGEGFLYSRELPAEEGENAYQQLMIMRYDGATALATSFEFSGIEQARFSPDGRRLAVLERADENTHLYVFDAGTYELLNDLSEMGFGSNTSAFLWNSLGNIVYAITGQNDIQIHQFDYSIPDESKRHSYVDRNSVDEGSFGLSDGELYFTYAAAEDGSIIFCIKPEGGVRKPFIPGGSFEISSDAKYMAVVTTSENAAQLSLPGLSLYTMATGEQRTVTTDFYPYVCLWSQDCSKLYYIESRVSGGQTEADTATEVDPSIEADTLTDGGEASSLPADDTNAPLEEQDPYAFTLWVYDIYAGQSTRLLDLATPTIFSSANPAVLYLNRHESDTGGTLIRATYILNLDTVFLAEDTGDDGDENKEESGALNIGG
ncbi:MAG: hypothetical protein LBS18_01730 [Clostridiales bacterium]|nr:hypothetical protein [Clostridiales bacterium]